MLSVTLQIPEAVVGPPQISEAGLYTPASVRGSLIPIMTSPIVPILTLSQSSGRGWTEAAEVIESCHTTQECGVARK